jgi:hypothetical protein
MHKNAKKCNKTQNKCCINKYVASNIIDTFETYHYPWKLSKISRLAPETNTNFFCALCPHSCARGNNFPVSHPTSNRFRPSMLDLEFFSDELLENKVHLVDMSILSIILSPRSGCHTLTPSEDRRPRRSTRPTPGTPPLGACLCIQCQPMFHDGPHAHAPDPHTPMLPQGSALIPNLTP